MKTLEKLLTTSRFTDPISSFLPVSFSMVSCQGSLAPPNAIRNLRIQPDRALGTGTAILKVDHAVAQLIDVAIDMAYSPEKRFRVTIDKRDQARALVLGALSKDSNGDMHVAFNSTALSAGQYDVSIQALPMLGAPTDAGWLVLDVH